MKQQLLRIPSDVSPRRLSVWGLAIAQAVLIGLAASVTMSKAEESMTEDEGVQVLTRGPVHEAFAEIVTYNPEPGVIVEKAPPEPIEELPPEERPAGDNITWIPGYWAWDDERTDFIWISGTWRALPPGRQWTTGYWANADKGYQWISGYWADATVQETAYLPKPPATIEAGPNVASPSNDHAWSPGSWVWQQERYAWRPGYWAEGRSDWVWIPARYVWTPRGYVFVEGYWDYGVSRRGVLYAPVYFQSGYYSRPGYTYSPTLAIGLAALVEHLFLRPRNHHYYFGDYYDRRYRDNGYYSPYAYQTSRYGYDPVYSYRRWTHRDDRGWERSYESSYDYRRDNETARPPRTWIDQQRLSLNTKEVKEQQLLMAAPLNRMAKNEDSPISLQAVPTQERQKLADRGREVRKNSAQRKALESEGAKISGGKNEQEIKPTKVKLPSSPIVGKSPDRFSKKEAPPKPQTTTRAASNGETSDRKPDPKESRPEIKGQSRPSEADTKREPKQPQPNSRQEPQSKNKEQTPKPQQEPRQIEESPPPSKKKQVEPRQEPQTKNNEQTREPQQEPRRREEMAPPIRKQQVEPERRVEKPARQESPPVREADRKAEPEARQAAPAKPSGPSKAKEPNKQKDDDSDQLDEKDRKKERK
jgi:hypothetical protein